MYVSNTNITVIIMHVMMILTPSGLKLMDSSYNKSMGILRYISYKAYVNVKLT